MFRITANFDSQIEVGVPASEARAFFNEPRNFVELMPGVEAIDKLADARRRWTIAAPVPVLGSMRQSFVVAETENTEARVEWSPAPGETANLLRYSAEFTAQGETRTLIRLRQKVEIRRERAKDLHALAGWVGEERISKEMSRGVTTMMNAFLQSAKRRLGG